MSIRRLFFGLCFAPLLLAMGCGRNKEVLTFDHSFSYNLMRVPEWYPGEKTVLSPTEKEIIGRMGPPDFFRFWWNEDGDFVTSSDLHRQFREMNENMKGVKQTWIYAREEREIEFKPTGEYFEHPLPQKIKLIARYGDPSEKSPPRSDARGRTYETWIWIDHGLKVEFMDGMEIKRDHFSGTGRGTFILK